ncbi:MAG: SsrA-binding protein SmpB [Candidatus Pacebacteria bacterium]|nr:SsrA-binding protein SmpB [Candidatus Paceibacterota bacterium]
MKIHSVNKKAYFEYNILEKLEAGIVLIGQEVKSIKLGHINLKGSYVIPKDSEMFLIGAHVPPYQPKNIEDYHPERSRKLLLKKKEIAKLIGKAKEKGLTLVPLKVYSINNIIKVEIGIVKGKKTTDKRESIRRREIDRDIRRSLKV